MITLIGRRASPIALRAGLTPGTAATLGVLALVPLFAAAAANLGGTAAVWENAHWTLSSLIALLIGVRGVRTSIGSTLRVRALAIAGLAAYLAGSVLWDIQVILGVFPVPAPSDVMFLGAAVPLAGALVLHARASLTRGELIALILDGGVVALAIATAVLYAYEPIATGARTDLGFVLLAYPITFLGLAAFSILAGWSKGAHRWYRGPVAVAVGLAITGVAWVVWIASALESVPPAGTLLNSLSSVAIVLVGFGTATWNVNSVRDRPDALSAAARVGLPLGAGLVAAAFLIVNGSNTDGLALRDLAAWSVITLVIVRQTLLLRERTQFLRTERTLRDEAQRALAAESASEQRYRAVVSEFGRLGEQLTFAAAEDQMLAAAAAATIALVPETGGEVQLLNPSHDRLTIALAWGTGARTPGELPDVDTPLACFGLRRSSVYVTTDVAAEFAVACPALPATGGAVACVPMISNGQPVGVIHLTRNQTFGNDELKHAARIAEQLALAIANARLLRTMENLALTDPLTGLYNKRFFDPYAERELAAATRDGEQLGVVMIDLDRFKAFNDTYGHPAGDEALRAFARSAQSAIRRSDTLARYGGEEFVLLLRDADVATAEHIAEKVRAAVEDTVVDLGGGTYGRISASFGVASSATHGSERSKLLRAADRALYAAKQSGRNRVARAVP